MACVVGVLRAAFWNADSYRSRVGGFDSLRRATPHWLVKHVGDERRLDLGGHVRRVRARQGWTAASTDDAAPASPRAPRGERVHHVRSSALDRDRRLSMRTVPEAVSASRCDDVPGSDAPAMAPASIARTSSSHGRQRHTGMAAIVVLRDGTAPPRRQRCTQRILASRSGRPPGVSIRLARALGKDEHVEQRRVRSNPSITIQDRLQCSVRPANHCADVGDLDVRRDRRAEGRRGVLQPRSTRLRPSPAIRNKRTTASGPVQVRTAPSARRRRSRPCVCRTRRRTGGGGERIASRGREDCLRIGPRPRADQERVVAERLAPVVPRMSTSAGDAGRDVARSRSSRRPVSALPRGLYWT